MKGPSLIAIVGTVFIAAVPDTVCAERRILDYTFRSPSSWTFADGRVINVHYEPRQATRFTEGNSALHEVRFPEVITQIIASENKRALLVLVSRKISGGFKYDHVIAVRQLSNRSLIFEKRLEAGTGPIVHGRWVVELGAISDDGETALFKMAEPSSAVAPYTVGKVWETWHLPSSALLKSGLTICP